MNRNILKLISTTGIAALALSTATHTASAVPVSGLYIEDARCDNVPTQTLSHELGQITMFPLNEAIQVGASPTTVTMCVAPDGIANDWIVQMVNNSGQAWKNLFFVGNLGMTVGNSDGSMIDTVGAPGVTTDAFRIDGTVTNVPGGNNNLISESGIVNEIFEPGETWRFYVSNFQHPSTGFSPQPLFNTPGQFAGSALVNSAYSDTASILAQPVPEPTTIGAIGLVAASLLMRRPSRLASRQQA